MFGLGLQELLILLGIAILIFGARRLPEVGAGLGKAIKNFKVGVSGKEEIEGASVKKEIPEGENSSSPVQPPTRP